jgi:hypothetical protein
MDPMLRRIGVLVVWILATMGTAALTYAAVSSAGRAVGENPAAPVAGAAIAARISTTTLSVTDGSSSTTVSLPEPTITSPTGPTTTISGTTNPTVTTTTVVTGTTSGAATQHWKTVPGVGTVGVSVSGDTVLLVSVTPVSPYHVDVKDDGPEKVEVEFDSESAEYNVRATIEDGELLWVVEQSGEGGGDGDG